MVSVTMLIILVVISLLLAFAIGANDETFATVVGVKRLSVRTAVLMGAVIALIGGFFLSDRVGKTLRNDISPIFEDTVNQYPILISIYVAMAISLILASVFGLPISSTEALVGAIIGLSFALGYKVNWTMTGMGKVLVTWLISPIIGFTISFLIMKLVRVILAKSVKSFRQHESANNVFGVLLLVMVVWTGLARAGNDINNAIAPIVPLFEGGGYWYQRLPLLIGGIGLGLGLIIIGWRVLKTLGNDVVELTPESAFVTEGSAAIVVFLAVIIGIPVSGTMVLVSSFMGAGVSMKKPLNLKTVRLIVIFVVLTPIISGLIAVGCYYAIRGLF